MHEHAATRLFVFPVAGRHRWAFIAKPPSLLHPLPPPGQLQGPSAPSPAPGSTGAAGAQAPTQAPPGWLGTMLASGRELIQKASGAANRSERVEIVADYLADSMHSQWVKLEESPEKSWKRRVHNWGTALLSRLRASETLFKTVPKKAPGLEIVYPAGLNPTLVRRRVRLLAQGGEKVHQCSLYGATAILPFTMILGVLPVPNLPFFWNVFRIHAHWSAMRGSRRLLELATVPPPQGEKREDAGAQGEEGKGKGVTGGRGPQASAATTAPTGPLKLVQSEELAALIADSADEDGALSDEAIASLCAKLDLDPHLVQKWKTDKLDKK